MTIPPLTILGPRVHHLSRPLRGNSDHWGVREEGNESRRVVAVVDPEHGFVVDATQTLEVEEEDGDVDDDDAATVVVAVQTVCRAYGV